jgi:hypothetical protein
LDLEHDKKWVQSVLVGGGFNRDLKNKYTPPKIAEIHCHAKLQVEG